MDDMIEMLVGERINQIIEECRERKQRRFEARQKLVRHLRERDRRRLDRFLEDLLEEQYEDLQTAYCGGLEDGIRIGRRIMRL